MLFEWTAPERHTLASLVRGGPWQLGAAALDDGRVIGLHGPHVGRSIVLMFEGPIRPRSSLWVCCMRGESWPLAERPGPAKVEVVLRAAKSAH